MYSVERWNDEIHGKQLACVAMVIGMLKVPNWDDSFIAKPASGADYRGCVHYSGQYITRDVSPGNQCPMISSNSRERRHTFVSVRVHVVFRVRRGFPLIKDELQERAWAYIGGIANRLGLKLYQAGGARDHAHVFFGLPASITLASVVQKMKSNSSAWLRQQPEMARFEWQEGYGAFSVSVSQTEATMAYIRGQREHHGRRDFDGELQDIMKRNGVVPTGLGMWTEETEE